MLEIWRKRDKILAREGRGIYGTKTTRQRQHYRTLIMRLQRHR